MKSPLPILYLVVPCFNEQAILPVTSKLFEEKIIDLIQKGQLDGRSRVLFVDDGSTDNTWSLVCDFSQKSEYVCGISQSRNRGHQSALLAGLMEAKDRCDMAISIDCDGQDDIGAIDEMVAAFQNGNEVVYGVRSKRETDTFFKRFTAESFYKILKWMGAEIIFNHADYRLLSSRVLEELASFKEVNLFLRGLIPLIGFKSTIVYYERKERFAGESHYPLKKMLSLAFDGITSLSIKPIHMITGTGFGVALLSFIGVIWSIMMRWSGAVVSGWASMTCIICFIGGIQLVCMGIIGEYVGKIYMETKSRPRYIISRRVGQGWEERIGSGGYENADRKK